MSQPISAALTGRRAARLARPTTKPPDDLRRKLRSLQALIDERDRKALNAPITSEVEFALRLPQIERAYRDTRFDSYLKSAARHLHDYLQGIEKQETYEYWKARTLEYELNDVFNLSHEINEKALLDGQRIHDELRMRSVRWDKKTTLSMEEREILREKVLLCACRGNELKRQGEANSALDLFEWLMEFTTSKLKTVGFPCYTTRATLCYHIGTSLRTLEQHRRAEAKYSEALDLLYTRGKRLEPSDHLFVIRKQAMVVGLGFGWVNMTRGFLARAEHALTTARSMLASVNDPLVSSYVELLYGIIQRCRAGSNKEKLEIVISQLQDTRRSFMYHPRYQARTCWELALAKTLIGDIPGAEKDLAFVSLQADRSANPKWQVNVHILRSRIYQRQKRIKEAVIAAEMAVDKAKSPESKTILPLVDAYITRGEAFLLLADSATSDNHYVTARDSFEKALQCVLNRKVPAGKPDYFSNPKIAAVCSLRIAQCYTRLSRHMHAKKHYAVWSMLEQHVEHEWVRELAREVKREIDNLAMDFSISASEHHRWNYSENAARLRRWLLTQSLRHTNQNYSEAARLLGVQRATLYQWQTLSASDTQSRARSTERKISNTGALNSAPERPRKERFDE